MSFLKNQPIEIENSYRFRSWVSVHPVETVYGTLTAKLFREYVYMCMYIYMYIYSLNSFAVRVPYIFSTGCPATQLRNRWPFSISIG